MQPCNIRMNLCITAADDYRCLLSRGYPPASALQFVGNHFQLRRDERDFLFRGVCSPAQAGTRKAKTVVPQEIKGSRLVIDGYNCLITLENAMNGRMMILGDDGFVRDTARIFRKFRSSELTRNAWWLIMSVLTDFSPSVILTFLDSSMSGSGELAARINRWLHDSGLAGRCITVRRSEKKLADLKGIKVSADSVIIDSSSRVFDLAGYIITRRLKTRLYGVTAIDGQG